MLRLHSLPFGLFLPSADGMLTARRWHVGVSLKLRAGGEAVHSGRKCRRRFTGWSLVPATIITYSVGISHEVNRWPANRRPRCDWAAWRCADAKVCSWTYLATLAVFTATERSLNNAVA